VPEHLIQYLKRRSSLLPAGVTYRPIRTTSSPILSALYRGEREEARRLAEGGTLDLFEAAALGRASRVRAALEESPELATATTDDGFTALHLAAFFSGDAECARLLLDAGTDPEALAANETGLRPIHSAAAASSNDIVSLLIERGAAVDPTQRGGFTPLHAAAANGDQALVALLMGAGADPGRRTDEGSTAAELAERRGHDEIARRLGGLEAGLGG
jgi:ankyrin repeat protein